MEAILVATEAKSILDLVTAGITVRPWRLNSKIGANLHGTGGTIVNMIVTGALGLVEGFLTSTLALVGLQAAGNAIGGVGGSLINLVLSGLGRIRGELLLGL
jgi:hypothetical protein